MIMWYKRLVIILSLIISMIICALAIYVYCDSYGIYSERKIESQEKIGATYMTMNNPCFKIINDEIRNVVEGNGDTLVTRDSALNLDKQIQQINEFIVLKVKAIFINPVDWKGIRPALEKAKKAGIIIIAIDSSVYDDDLISFSVVSDNYDAGVQCAENLMKSRSGGNIMLLEHNSAKSAIDRIKGFEDKIKSNPNFQIVGRVECQGQLEIAEPKVKDFLNKRPDVDIIMALNDPSALGSIVALEKVQKKDVKVYGVDGSPDGKNMVKDNKMTATVAQFPEQIGREAAEEMYNLFQGRQVDKEIVIPVKIINKDNINDYDLDGWQ